MAYHKGKNIWKLISICLIINLIACTSQPLPPVNPYNDTKGTSTTTITPISNTNFLTDRSFDPSNAKYFDLINNVFTLTPEERTLLKQNGFFVSDRIAFNTFTTAYAYIYWKDLPVIVTTDSILQSIHQTYEDLLTHIELTILTPKLNSLLIQIQNQVQTASSSNTNPNFEKAYHDLEIYLTVPLVLLSTDNEKNYDTPEIDGYVKLAEAADSVLTTDLFNNPYEIDFTIFKPRGHYTQVEALQRYFRAMSWLEHIDFPSVGYKTGNPELNIEALVAAVLLRDAIDQSAQRPNWNEIDVLLTSLIGRSDNMTLGDLDRFLMDAGINSATNLINDPNPDQILNLLITNDYGKQRITGQILTGGAYSPDPVNRPISFKLLGDRFSVDSYLMSNLVYDRLLVNGEKVQRPFPSPLDIMYVLGNDQAALHLQGELNKYGYQANLDSLRTSVAGYEPGFWSGNVYNQWLEMIRSLNTNSLTEKSPQALKTSAWADKMLQTQLASWAQLRHDNVLYSKQPYTVEPMCEYPAGYVEPYPAFYAAVRQYAEFGQTLMSYINPNNLTDEGRDTYQKGAQYFTSLASVAQQLQTLAEKEINLEPFTQDEELFLKSIAIRQLKEENNICALVTREEWNGWYVGLFPWRDDNPGLIADIHTNTNTDPSFPALLPPGVLHIGTGSVAAMVFLVDTDESITAYVGPAFTYFETIEEGYPPVRLTDEEWDKRLNSDLRPTPPAWTSSFRIPSSSVPTYLELPTDVNR